MCNKEKMNAIRKRIHKSLHAYCKKMYCKDFTFNAFYYTFIFPRDLCCLMCKLLEYKCCYEEEKHRLLTFVVVLFMQLICGISKMKLVDPWK